LIFTQVRFAGWYSDRCCFAMTPSRPRSQTASNRTAPSSNVAGVVQEWPVETELLEPLAPKKSIGEAGSGTERI
jgi:hypothetical protein